MVLAAAVADLAANESISGGSAATAEPLCLWRGGCAQVENSRVFTGANIITGICLGIFLSVRCFSEYGKKVYNRQSSRRSSWRRERVRARSSFESARCDRTRTVGNSRVAAQLEDAERGAYRFTEAP